MIVTGVLYSVVAESSLAFGTWLGFSDTITVNFAILVFSQSETV